MDVDSLKAELEEHLAKNPDDQAPDGFRDRFNVLLEQYQANDGEHGTKAVIETELQQIRAEAEAAWRCCESPRAEEAPPRAEAVEAPVAPAPGDPVRAQVDEHVNPAAPGFMQRYGLSLIVAVVVLGAAYYFFRR
jgi:hypothetical protein